MKFSLRGHRWVLTAPLLLLAPACGGGDHTKAGGDAAGDSAPAVTQAPPPPSAPAGTLTDGNIVAILSASGQAEIIPSDSVKDRVEDARVKRFALLMITQHTALGDTVGAVAQQINITAEPNAASAKLDSTTSATVQQLRGLSGAKLDRAFMQYMVTSHQEAHDTVTLKLIPAAQNPRLRATMQDSVLPVVNDHLRHARALLDSLGSP